MDEPRAAVSNEDDRTAEEDDRTAEKAVPSEGAPQTRIELRYESRRSEILRASAWAGRRSDVGFAIGLVAISAGILAFVAGDRLTFWFPLLLGLSMVTGALMIPVVWFAVRRQPKLIGPIECEIDESGIHERTQLTDTRVAWDMYRDVVETGDSVYLVSVAGVGFIPKRAFSPEQLEALRRLVAAKGLVKGRRLVRRIAVTFVAFGVVGAVSLGPILVDRVLASAPRVELRPVVADSTVEVTVTTDLPDGTYLVLEVYHVDEYDRAVARGEPEDADNRWVEYEWLEVRDGAFGGDFDIGHWPQGRGRAVVWVTDDLQEPDVAAWFAERSASFSGPNVSRLPDGLLELRYWQDFEVR